MVWELPGWEKIQTIHLRDQQKDNVQHVQGDMVMVFEIIILLLVDYSNIESYVLKQ